MSSIPRIPLCVAALAAFLAGTPSDAAIEYTLLDLRVLSGDAVGEIHPYSPGGINDLGQVAGFGYLIPDHTPSDDATSHPFFYDPASGRFVNLGDIDGNMGESGNGGNAYGISDTGWVTGRNTTDQEPAGYRAFYWKDLNGNGITDAGEMNDLGVDEGYDVSYGWGLNNMGQIVGTQSNYDLGTSIGWLWTDANENGSLDDGEKTLLPGTTPSGINDAGQVVGSFPLGNGRWTDFNENGAVDDGELAPIGNLVNGTKAPTAERINASGQVGGIMENAYAKKQAYLWTDADGNNVAEASEVITFGSDLQNTFVRDMNDAGTIVGGSYHWRYQPGKGSSRRAYIWDSVNGIRDLNELIPAYSIDGYGPFEMSQAEGINNLGQIVVTGWFDNDGNGTRGSREPEHVIVLTPRLAGDLNLDGVVASGDLDLVRANWGRQVEPGSLSDGDASGDGEVNSQDLDMVRSTWGQGSAASAVPEPSSGMLALALLIGAVAARRRCRRGV